MSDAVKFSENFNFLQTGCFHHEVWGREFFWPVMRVRLLNAVNFMWNTWGQQVDLGPVEAVEGPKMAMLKKIRLVALLIIFWNIRPTSETEQTPEPQDVYLSGVCFVSQVTHIFGEIFNNATRVSKILLIFWQKKVCLKVWKLVAKCLGWCIDCTLAV